MNPSTYPIKVPGFRVWQAAARRLLLAGILAGISGTAFSQTTDLSYNSPSTGADGALVIPSSLPAVATDGSPLQLAYNASQNYLLATGSITETSTSTGTFVQEQGVWSDSIQSFSFYGTSIVYDGARNEILRFGGKWTNSNNYIRGFDFWDGNDWTDKEYDFSTGPIERAYAGMVFDSARNEVIVFGGLNNNGELADTWAWDGSAWTDKTPVTSPSARISPSMAFDAARGEVVLFGGEYENDTWTWNGSMWMEESPSSVPPSRESSSMAYDPNRQVVVLCLTGSGGNLETWEWNGSNWSKEATTSDPGAREFHSLVYNPETSTVQLHNGEYPTNYDRNADSWSWNGSTWDNLTSSPYFFDMTAKPDGIWNYTTIDVGRTEVRFIKNSANTPVVWLATGDVIIDGHLNLNGTTAYQGANNVVVPYNSPAPGGPGGFDGGLGGYYETATGGDVAGSAGSGPGGGAGSLPGGANGDRDGFHAIHFDTYNSISLQSLSGGSGGGGAASATYNATYDFGRGGNGGGGGGAILIASSRNIWVNGSITAIGGEGRNEVYKRTNFNSLTTGISRGGSGSGGSIRLVADRVFKQGGTLDVSTVIAGGQDRDAQPENKGRIRIEAFYQNVLLTTNNNTNHYSITTPKTTLLGASAPSLVIDSIAGQNVSVNPSSDPATPEVTFSSAGAITVIVSSQNVPDGTTINLRITSDNEIVTAEPQVLAGGSASFSVVVPAGKGVVQAWTDWEVAP